MDVADAHVNDLEGDAGVRRIDRPGGRLGIGMNESRVPARVSVRISRFIMGFRSSFFIQTRRNPEGGVLVG